MPTLDQDLQKIREARLQIQNADKELYQSKLNRQKGSGDSATADLSVRSENYIKASSALDKARKELFERNGYKNIVANMSAEVPVLFFPIRIETRFVNVGNATELWIRIYPDDIHIHTHESLLTEDEHFAGRQYWLSLLKINRENISVEDHKKAVWKSFSEGRGVQRALWVAKQTMPLNWSVDVILEDEALQFSEVGDTKTHNWTQAPRTHLLPDQFVVSLYRSGKIVHTEVGAPVPDTVFLGPDPLQAKESFEKKDNSIVLDDSFAWITDFDKAVEKGLAMKIKVQEHFLNHGMIERIIVMGVCSSASVQEGKVLMEELIENHQYSAKGFSFLPQRSPTNNTESSGSVYRKNENYLPKGYYEGIDMNAFNDAEEDGFRFATLLGLDKAVLKNADHASQKQVKEALAMNKALYPATIGSFIENLAKPMFSEQQKSQLRDFFTDFVTASGPFPAIRIGDQPYSFLVTSDMAKWVDREPFFEGMTTVFKRLQSIWYDLSEKNVAHIGRGSDPSSTLIDILGLEAGSVSFIQRLAHLPDFSLSATNVIGKAGELARKQETLRGFVKSLHPYGDRMDVGALITNLHYYKFENKISLIKLVDGKTAADDRFLDKLGPKNLNYIEWLSQVQKEEEISSHNLGAGPPRSILYLLLRHSLLLELEKASKKYYSNLGVSTVSGLEKSFLNVSKEFKDLTSWELIKGTPSAINDKVFEINIPLGDYLLSRGWKDSRSLNEFKAALQLLGNLSTLRLQYHLTDHIDLCSYRLDSWQMGLFTRRLQQNRRKQPEGIYHGSYGWVENLRPSGGKVIEVPEALKPSNQQPVYKNPQNAGFVHTPSLNHATAAGLLLAGYQNHATRSDPGAFAVNLSSERVRKALFVIQGIQNNQRLEALLGYQFERALHDITTNNPANNLNQYILSLREEYPLESASIPQAGTEAQESVPAYAVVDGLKIANATDDELLTVVSNQTHLQLILMEKKRLEDTLDAINDLLITETAFQATQGKADRTAAVLNSLKNADIPPDLEFHKTPRSTHLSFTNRVTIHFDPKASQQVTESWTAKPSPRSLMEPGMNRWLGEIIGDPSQIISGVSVVDSEGNETQSTIVSLSELNIQPIDIIYLLGTDQQSGIKQLESYIEQAFLSKTGTRVERKLKIEFETTLSEGERSLAKAIPLIRSLRLLITNGRPASAKHFLSRPKSENEQQRFIPNWDVEELISRLNTVFNSLDAELKIIERLTISEPGGLIEGPSDLLTLFEGYYKEGTSIEKLEKVVIPEEGILKLDVFLRSGQNYGISTLLKPVSSMVTPGEIVDLLHSGASLWHHYHQKLAVAAKKIAAANEEPTSDLKITRLSEAGKALLGDDFIILPQFKFVDSENVSKVLSDEGAQLLKYTNRINHTTTELSVETWLESVARVRSSMGKLEQVRTIAEAQSDADIPFIAAQFPFNDKSSWLAVEFPATDEQTGEKFDILDDTVVMAIHGSQARNVNELQSALLIDEWTEAVPNDKEISGVSFNYDQPNASAPNAILVAVEPTGAAQWSWDTMLGIISNTFDRAKTRAVEPAHILEHPALDTLIPMTVANFDLRDANISLDYLTVNDHFIKVMANANLELYKAWK
ncbi:hypothetical protein B0I27_104295 [Arcticibacter pallidicorallinus]|uniref:Uncharacterized protein n=1 Tax=Arcticibacter pallidicorallinus TaxID=1259464 RepID=A0A2T0U5U0_9SPHI|nr:hypothetical protein [Arcticibacter pallidicorallinus]PRY53285.1 hypothetical protein B0I27_104295 [Arcticibacter pallidicorallinus]